jgi:hypothetical protein
MEHLICSKDHIFFILFAFMMEMHKVDIIIHLYMIDFKKNGENLMI